MTEVHCSVHLRHPPDDAGKRRYEPLYPSGTRVAGAFATVHPPAVGDVLNLTCAAGGRDEMIDVDMSGSYVVVARSWAYPRYGSRVWPYGTVQPESVSMGVVVEPHPGLFADEA